MIPLCLCTYFVLSGEENVVWPPFAVADCHSLLQQTPDLECLFEWWPTSQVQGIDYLTHHHPWPVRVAHVLPSSHWGDAALLWLGLPSSAYVPFHPAGWLFASPFLVVEFLFYPSFLVKNAFCVNTIFEVFSSLRQKSLME